MSSKLEHKNTEYKTLIIPGSQKPLNKLIKQHTIAVITNAGNKNSLMYSLYEKVGNNLFKQTILIKCDTKIDIIIT